MKTNQDKKMDINKQNNSDKYEAKEDSEKLAVAGNQTLDN